METIKKGFLLGVGLLIPLLIVEYLSAEYSFHKMNQMTADSLEAFKKEFDSDEDLYDEIELGAEEDHSNFEYEFNKSYVKDIEILGYNSIMQKNQLLIRGQIKNNAEKEISSIEIEAELFDEAGNFVFECTEYLSESIVTNAVENFLIKCGCSENSVPEYNKIEVSIARASAY
ncbi:MAG: FxLYD domain-containing protein [Gammaproteobacteria bacterium]